MSDLNTNSVIAAGDTRTKLDAPVVRSASRLGGSAALSIHRGREASPGTNGIGAVDIPRIEQAVREILLAVGEDPERDGLRETPRRCAKAFAEMFAGMREDAGRHLQTRFAQDSDEAVLVSDIDFSSTCEHHLLPFFGKAHVAYLPAAGQVVGLSKLARTIDTYARRPQMQERLVAQIADALESHLDPRGVCVVLQAEHLCMRLRGTCKPGAITTTVAFRGQYRTDESARAEVLSLLLKPGLQGVDYAGQRRRKHCR